MRSTIERLPRPEHSGDWHDKPLRWAVRTGKEYQKFSTQKDARLYRRLRDSSPNEAAATRAYIDAA